MVMVTKAFAMPPQLDNSHQCIDLSDVGILFDIRMDAGFSDQYCWHGSNSDCYGGSISSCR